MLLERVADATKNRLEQAAQSGDWPCVPAPGGHGVLFLDARHRLCERYLGAFQLKLWARTMLRLVGSQADDERWSAKEFKLAAQIWFECFEVKIGTVLASTLLPLEARARCMLLTLRKIADSEPHIEPFYVHALDRCESDYEGAAALCRERLARVSDAYVKGLDPWDLVLMADLQADLAAAFRRADDLEGAVGAYEASMRQYVAIAGLASIAEAVAAPPLGRMAAAKSGLAHVRARHALHPKATAMFEEVVNDLDDAESLVEQAFTEGTTPEGDSVLAIRKILWVTDHRWLAFPSWGAHNHVIRWLPLAGQALDRACAQIEKTLGIPRIGVVPTTTARVRRIEETLNAGLAPLRTSSDWRKLGSMLTCLGHLLERDAAVGARRIAWTLALSALAKAGDEKDRPIRAAILVRIGLPDAPAYDVQTALRAVHQWALEELRDARNRALAAYDIVGRHASWAPTGASVIDVPWRSPPGILIPVGATRKHLDWSAADADLARPSPRRPWLAACYFLHVLHCLLCFTPSAQARGAYYGALARWLGIAAADREPADACCLLKPISPGLKSADIEPQAAARIVIEGLARLREFHDSRVWPGMPLNWSDIDIENADVPEFFRQFRYGPEPRLEWVLKFLSKTEAKAAVEGTHLLAAMAADSLVDLLRPYQASNAGYTPDACNHVLQMMSFGRTRLHLADPDAPRRAPRQMLTRLFGRLSDYGVGALHRGTLRHNTATAMKAAAIQPDSEFEAPRCGLCRWEVPHV